MADENAGALVTPDRIIGAAEVQGYVDLTWFGGLGGSEGRDVPMPPEFLLGLVFGLEGWSKEVRAGIIALLEVTAVRFLAPFHPGEPLRVRTEVASSRPSSSRPDRSVVTLRSTALSGERALLEVERVALFARQDREV